MHVLYLTKDLFFSSRVCSLARSAGLRVEVVASIEACVPNTDTVLAIIDLNLAGLDVAAVVSHLRNGGGQFRIIAYGPHVDEATLAAAVQAGCDAVLPRSQFDRQIAGILQQVATGSGSAD